MFFTVYTYHIFGFCKIFFERPFVIKYGRSKRQNKKPEIMLSYRTGIFIPVYTGCGPAAISWLTSNAHAHGFPTGGKLHGKDLEKTLNEVINNSRY